MFATVYCPVFKPISDKKLKLNIILSSKNLGDIKITTLDNEVTKFQETFSIDVKAQGLTIYEFNNLKGDTNFSFGNAPEGVRVTIDFYRNGSINSFDYDFGQITGDNKNFAFS